MVYYDDSGRRIHRPVKRRTPRVGSASAEAGNSGHNSAQDKPGSGGSKDGQQK